jgi:outer membrane protein assembly factor BamE (lipoprotein component of BamABCDE complex)
MAKHGRSDGRTPGDRTWGGFGLLGAAGASLLAFLIGGCDRQKIAELEEGVATEADVRQRFGEPAAVYPEPDGGRTFEYPRQPEGQTNYMITIGSDGRMSALRQVLKPADFAKVAAGLDKREVRRLLGRPAATQLFGLKRQEVWDWRYADGQEARLFSVTFDADGRVVSTASTLDLRGVVPGGK